MNNIKVILSMIFLLLSSSAYAAKRLYQIDQGYYSILSNKNLDIKTISAQLVCRTYSKFTILGNPTSIRSHTSQIVEFENIEFSSEFISQNGIELREYSVEIPEDILAKFKMPFRHYLFACDMNFNIQGLELNSGIEKEKVLTFGVGHGDDMPLNITTNFEKQTISRVFYINKYTNEITVDFLSSESLSSRIKE